MGYQFIIYAIILVIIFIVFPPIIRKQTYKKCMEDLENQNFEKFEKDIDSLASKMSFSAFSRECLRLSEYEAMGNLKKADEQVQFMENMRLNKKQKAILGERGFYVYLSSGKIKKARRMLEMVKEFGTPQQVEPLELSYSILLKKESKHINTCKERYSKLWDGKSPMDSATAMRAGTMEYFLGLQYSYDKDVKNTKHYMNLAKEHLAGTPYIEDINRVLASI